MIYNSKNKATAIITAVLIVAVVSIAAITMQGYLNSEMNRTKLILDNDKLLNKAYDIESWGLAKLKQIISQNKAVTGDEVYKLELKNYDVQLLGEIQNQNGLFNINYLHSMDVCTNGAYDPTRDIKVIIFTRLLKLQEVNTILGDDEISNLITSIQNWMCVKNNEPISMDINSNSKWSYQKAGQILMDKSELRLVPGMNWEIYNKISKHLTAFPVGFKGASSKPSFNINYVTPTVFAAIAGVDKVSAKSFLDQLRTKTAPEKTTAIRDYLAQLKTPEQVTDSAKDSTVKMDVFSTDLKANNYYIILSRAVNGEYVVQMRTLVQVVDNQLNVLWRKQGLQDE